MVYPEEYVPAGLHTAPTNTLFSIMAAVNMMLQYMTIPVGSGDAQLEAVLH